MMRIWLWPLALGLLSALGLLAGLVSDGAGDWFGWLALGLPTLVGLQGMWRGRAPTQAPRRATAVRRAERG